MDTYASRLAHAMSEARMHPQTLADHLETSLQAVRKVLSGGSAAFNVPNHFKVCAILRVDADWLATGEGDMVSGKVWPFALMTPEQIKRLSPEHLQIVENLALQLLPSKANPETDSISRVNTESQGSRKTVVRKFRKDEEANGKRDSNPPPARGAAGGG